jgi:hypothetical protein
VVRLSARARNLYESCLCWQDFFAFFIETVSWNMGQRLGNWSSFACQTVLFSMDLLACETVLLHYS